jgi:hypothetical protein
MFVHVRYDGEIVFFTILQARHRGNGWKEDQFHPKAWRDAGTGRPQNPKNTIKRF